MKRPVLSSFVVSCALAASLSAQPLIGLHLWLRGDAITSLNNGNKVATWPDASGCGNQPVFATSALNGLPAVRFADVGNAANAGQYLDSTTAINANRTPLTIFVVFKSEVAATALPGSWNDSGQPIATEGSENTVYDASSPARHSYQLIQH